MRAGYVPTDRVGPVLDSLIKDRWPHGDGQNVLADKVGCDESAIGAIRGQVWPGVKFDLADKLFCALGRPDIWWGVLNDVYYAVTFVHTCELPGCSKTFPEKVMGDKRKRYCCRAHSGAGQNIKSGDQTGHQRLGVCRKGLHKMTEANTYVLRQNGREYKQCKACKKAYQNERYRTNAEYRAKQQANNKAYKARRKAA